MSANMVRIIASALLGISVIFNFVVIAAANSNSVYITYRAAFGLEAWSQLLISAAFITILVITWRESK